MTEQSEASDVGGGANKTTFGQFRADRVDLRHERDDVSAERPRGDSAFDAGGGDAGAERFREHEQIAGPRVCIRRDFAAIDNSGHGEPVNRFRITNGMSADDGAADFGRLLETTAQDGGNCFCRNEIGWETHDVQSGDRPAAHRKNVGERVGGGDLSVGKRVVHDRA